MLEKTKEHLKKHKTAYLVGAGVVTSVVLGAVVTAVTRNGKVANQTVVGFKVGDVTQTIEIYIEALGDPGNIIQDVATGTVYASQGEAARTLGIPPSVLSKHLNGHKADAHGHVFAKLGKAPVSA
ncbi:MAG TPA: hypothetical protein PKC73_00020 [Dermatophilaceae bacterium]|jgi:hypothetical protein|nr:hypothetical protein [Dermatophilaceae bacterium]